MLDERQTVYVKIIDDRLYLRLVNHKLITKICELIQVELHTDEKNHIYVDECDMNKLIKGLLLSNKTVHIV